MVLFHLKSEVNRASHLFSTSIVQDRYLNSLCEKVETVMCIPHYLPLPDNLYLHWKYPSAQ